MNYNKEPFPENITSLVNQADNYATQIQQKLNAKHCPAINDLYWELHKTCDAKPEFSIIKQKKVFEALGYFPNIKSGNVKAENEFKGLYIFGEADALGNVTPVYVGISRSVYKRLKNHAFGKTSNTATLAYLMAKHQYKTKHKIEKVTKSNIENKEHLEPQKEIIQNYKVVLIPVTEDYDLYFLEVALAGILKTKWNSFRTH